MASDQKSACLQMGHMDVIELTKKTFSFRNVNMPHLEASAFLVITIATIFLEYREIFQITYKVDS